MQSGRNWQKKALTLLSLGQFACGALGADSLDAKFAFLVGFNEWHFFVEENQVSKQVPFTIERKSFPMQLGAAARLAEQHAVTRYNLTNHITLNRILMKRALIFPEIGEVTNIWFIAFTFLVQPQGQPKYVVMLMDGSFATEKPRSDVVLKNEVKSEPQPLTESPTRRLTGPGGGVQVPAPAEPYASELLGSSTFKIPAVQWNPSEGEPPIDVALEADQAAHKLAAENPQPPGALSLAEISIENYVPIGAIKAAGLHFFDNLHHWVVVFKYCRGIQSGASGYSVYMLLDRTVLRIEERSACE
jgi:hypothetical protein